MKIVICDDEIPILNFITRIVQESVDSEGVEAEITSCSTGEAVIKHFESGDIDLAFLDIDMPGIGGLKTAESLLNSGNNKKIVFVSSYEDLVFEGQTSFPLCSIRKADAEKQIPKIVKQYFKNRLHDKKYITICEDRVNVSLEIDKILYITRVMRKCEIYSLGGKMRSCREPLTTLHSRLKIFGFYDVNRATVVNMRYISDIASKYIKLTDDSKFEISQKSREKLIQIYSDFRRRD